MKYLYAIVGFLIGATILSGGAQAATHHHHRATSTISSLEADYDQVTAGITRSYTEVDIFPAVAVGTVADYVDTSGVRHRTAIYNIPSDLGQLYFSVQYVRTAPGVWLVEHKALCDGTSCTVGF